MPVSLDVLVTNFEQTTKPPRKEVGGMLFRSSIFNVKAPGFLRVGLDGLTFFAEMLLQCQV